MDDVVCHEARTRITCHKKLRGGMWQRWLLVTLISSFYVYIVLSVEKGWGMWAEILK